MAAAITRPWRTSCPLMALFSDRRHCLSQKDWITISEGVMAARTGMFAVVRIDVQKNFAPRDWTELATLPEGMRPGRTIYMDSQIGGCTARAYANADGLLRVYNLQSTAGNAMADTLLVPLV